MPFNKEFEHHLHEVMVSASLEVRDEIDQYKRELVWKAQQTHNSAAMPLAYKEAGLYDFRTRTQRVIDRYFQALDDCGIAIDANVERDMLAQIGMVTGAQNPLTFPPGLRISPQLASVQRAYGQEIARVGNQLQREAANRLRGAKMKNASSGAAVTALPQDPAGKAARVAREDSGQTFISYSWDSDEHRAWVEEFATALRQNGVDVVLDRWHLPPGADMYRFMESTVRSVEFVLVICTPAYAEKAENRVGGVGYETTIITAQLARKTDERKFIPILRSGDWASAVPLWLASRRGLDFRDNPYSDAKLQNLLRTLHREEVQAPALGPRPLFSSEDIPAERISKLESGGEPQEPKTPTPAKAPLKKSEAIAYALYETTGPDAQKVQVYIRRSPTTEGLFTFENSLGEERHGTREDIAARYVLSDRQLTMSGFKRMNTGNGSGDRAFDL
jgi:hypothetical protein